MTRPYTQRKRAEQRAETRRRIVEAAVDLHGSVGPAATSLSMVAERANVQRHTLYAHFPDERSLFLACSALSLERDPLPDATEWTRLRDPRERLAHGLASLYRWYDRNAALAACVLRDAEHHALTREITELRYGPVLSHARRVLGDGLVPPQHALLAAAMDFHCWRALATEGRLAPVDAAGVMADAIASARPPVKRRATRGPVRKR